MCFNYQEASAITLSKQDYQYSMLILVFSIFHLFQLIDSEKIICHGSTKPLNGMSFDDFCPSLTETLVASSVFLGSIGIMFGILIFVYYRHEQEIKVWLFAHRMLLWWVTEEDYDTDKKYDAFVSYAEQDHAFVRDKFIPKLESNKFKVCHHMRDFVAGEWIADEIRKSVLASRRTIIVLSENFIKSQWCMVEFKTAYELSVKENCARVIILVYGDLPSQEKLSPEMRTYMSMNTYAFIDYKDSRFWEKLKYKLPHPPSRPVHSIPMTDVAVISPGKEPQCGQYSSELMQQG